MEGKKVTSFTDLDVYQRTYRASLIVMKEIIPRLPETEKFDLKDQMSRACKAVPRLIAEGYAKRHQRKGFQKYIDDAMGESNEMVVCLSHCRDIYGHLVDKALCQELINSYDIAGRQLYRLAQAWDILKETDQ